MDEHDPHRLGEGDIPGALGDAATEPHPTVAQYEAENAGQFDPIVEGSRNPESHWGWVRNTRAGRATAALTLVATGSLAGLAVHSFGNESSSSTSSHNTVPASAGLPAKSPTPMALNSKLTALKSTSPLEVTDAILNHGGFNCGHTIAENTPMSVYDYSPQIAFLNEKPAVADNVFKLQVKDSVWGMGDSAWNVIKSEAVKNSATPDSATVTASKDMNAYAHLMQAYELPADKNYFNFTCTDGKGNATEVHLASVVRLKSTNHVTGFELTQAGLQSFEQVVRKYPDGTNMFDIIAIGTKDVPDANGNIVKQNMFMVVVAFEGCDNPNRVPPKSLPISPPTTTSVPESTTSTTVVPPTTGFSPKLDRPLPSTGGAPTSSTTIPAPHGPATPDNGSQNPVGGIILPPTTQNTNPAETTTTSRVTTTTTFLPPPTSTPPSTISSPPPGA